MSCRDQPDAFFASAIGRLIAVVARAKTLQRWRCCTSLLSVNHQINCGGAGSGTGRVHAVTSVLAAVYRQRWFPRRRVGSGKAGRRPRKQVDEREGARRTVVPSAFGACQRCWWSGFTYRSRLFGAGAGKVILR